MTTNTKNNENLKYVVQVKTIFETALSKGMESYKQAEALWLSYLEYTRRRTDFADYSELDRLRRTFRLAWDSLAEVWLSPTAYYLITNYMFKIVLVFTVYS